MPKRTVVRHDHGTAVFSRAFPRSLVYARPKGIGAFADSIFRGGPVDLRNVYRPPSYAEIDRLVARAMRHIRALLKARGERRRLTAAERSTIRREVARSTHAWFAAPSFDAAHVLRMTEFAGVRARLLGNRFFLVQDGAILYSTPAYQAPFPECVPCKNDEEAERGARALGFGLDIMLEVFGLVFGVIGLTIPKPTGEGTAEVRKLLAALLSKDWFKRVWENLVNALRSGSAADAGKAAIEFMEALEQTGNLAEIYAHLLAGMHWYDYLITFLKIVAWIIAATATAGIAMAAKIIGLGLDVIGLGIKLHEASEWQEGRGEGATPAPAY